MPASLCWLWFICNLFHICRKVLWYATSLCDRRKLNVACSFFRKWTSAGSVDQRKWFWQHIDPEIVVLADFCICALLTSTAFIKTEWQYWKLNGNATWMTAACQFQTLKNVEKTEMVFPGDSPVLLLLVQSSESVFFLLLIVLVVSDFLYGTTILFFFISCYF